MKKHKKRLLSLLLIPLSILIIYIVKNNEWVAEYIFSRGVYKFISKVINSITRYIPFSLMEVSIYLLIIAILMLIIYIFNIMFNNINDRRSKFKNVIVNVACIFSILIFSFTLLAGINYHRYTFSKINNIIITDSSVDELYNLNVYLVEKASNQRKELELNSKHINSYGVLEISDKSWKDLTSKLNKAYENLSLEYPVLQGNYVRPKKVLSSKFMSWTKTTGIFWPFTMEANINSHAPDYTIPSTMAHEVAHLRGFMREDEANYIAFLVCKSSEDLVFQYSGTMLALTHAGNALYREDPILYSESRKGFSQGMSADIRDKSSYWSQFDNTVISTTANKVNDTYLKVNNQKDGVKSYGRMVDLLLAGFNNIQEASAD